MSTAPIIWRYFLVARCWSRALLAALVWAGSVACWGILAGMLAIGLATAAGLYPPGSLTATAPGPAVP